MPWLALSLFVVVVLLILFGIVVMVTPAQAAGGPSPFDYGVLTYLWVLCLSAFGGIVNFSRKLRDARTTPFRLTEFIGEIDERRKAAFLGDARALGVRVGRRALEEQPEVGAVGLRFGGGGVLAVFLRQPL